MSVDECISPEELARLFHRYHGVLTGCFDGRTATAPWEQVDAHQRRLLVATARLVLSDLAAKQHAGEALQSNADLRICIAAESEPGDSTHHDEAIPSDTDANLASRHLDCRYFAKPGEAEWGC